MPGLLILSAFIIITLFLLLDYQLGKKSHLKHLRFLDFHKTTGSYQIYTLGDPFFKDLFEDIKNAKQEVNVLFFIVKTDEISQEFYNILKDKAREGVKVRLLVDRIGSHRVNAKIRKDLKNAGVEFAFASTPKFPFFFYKLQRRNHRKITVIDGDIAYVGGFNVGKEYIGRDARLGNWRDYHLCLNGGIVHDLLVTFWDDWQLATGQMSSPKLPTDTEGDKEVEIAATDGGQLEDVFLTFIHQAKEEIFIGTPYFIPSERLFQALLKAIQRGVEIKVIVPMKADHPLVKEAGLPYMNRLRKAGGEVYFFDMGFYHAKVLIVDKKLCDIGTANFDRRSLFLNKEVNTIIHNARFVMDLRIAFLRDVQDSQPFDDHYTQHFNFGTKVRMGIAYFFRPLL